MNFPRLLNKKTFILFIFFASVFLFSFAMLNNNVLCYDDIILFSDSAALGLKAHINNINYGTWLLQAENLFLFYLPYKLGLNIQDWACFFGGIIKALTVTGFAVIFHNFMTTEKIPLKISLPVLLFFCFVYIVLMLNTAAIDFIIYHGFFRFVFSSCLMAVFTFMYYKLFVYKKCNLFVILPFSAITAASSEVTAAILLSIVFISVIIKVLYNKFWRLGNSLKLKNDLLIFSCLCIGLLLLFLSEGFWVHYGNSSKINSITDYIGLFFPFVKMFVKTIIINYIWVYFVCIFCYWLILTKSFPKICVRKIVFSAITIFSVWLFSFSLILMGKGSRGGGFWLDHPDIYSLIIPLFIISVIIPVSVILRKYFSKSKIQITAITFMALLLIYQPLANSYDDIKMNLTAIRKLTYIRDKALAFCCYSNFSLPQSDIIDYLYITHVEETNLEDIDKPILKLDNMEFFHDILKDRYLPFVYGIQEKSPQKIYGIITIKDTIQYLKAKGFTFDEIKDGKYKFSDLKNRDFVLNKQ